MTVLDTSAILVHFFKEPGADEVAEVFETGRAWLTPVTWLELRGQMGRTAMGEETVAIYRASAAGIIDITDAVAEAAWEIRVAAARRVPMVDSMIAGAARAHGMVLLHRDSHFASIPPRMLRQKMLPPK